MCQQEGVKLRFVLRSTPPHGWKNNVSVSLPGEKNGFRRFVLLFPSGLVSSFSKCPRGHMQLFLQNAEYGEVLSRLRHFTLAYNDRQG